VVRELNMRNLQNENYVFDYQFLYFVIISTSADYFIEFLLLGMLFFMNQDADIF